MNTTTTVRQPMTALAAVRDELRERRRARRQHRVLTRELASYTTRSQVNDLLAMIDRQDSADADQIRTILARNLQTNLPRRRMAS